tara:strand:+ start:476 stop:652 length:177 start_codon:yes stop_codon:yes gene_type:complete
MKDKDDILGFPVDPRDLEIRKLQKKLAFYRVYVKKLEGRLEKCQDQLRGASSNESGDS